MRYEVEYFTTTRGRWGRVHQSPIQTVVVEAGSKLEAAAMAKDRVPEAHIQYASPLTSELVRSRAPCERETNGFPIHCSFCDNPLEKPGALLISPPQPGSNRGAFQVIQMHICCACYEVLNT